MPKADPVGRSIGVEFWRRQEKNQYYWRL